MRCGCIRYPEMARVTVRNSEPTMWSWSQYDNDDMWQGYSLQIRSSVMFLRTWKTPFIATSLAYINCLIWRPRQMFNGTLKNTRRPEKTNFSRTAEYISTKSQLVTKSKTGSTFSCCNWTWVIGFCHKHFKANIFARFALTISRCGAFKFWILLLI